MKTTPDSTQHEDRVLWSGDLAKRYNKDRTTICRWQQAGNLPPPDICIGQRSGWFLKTIVAFEHASTQRHAA